jgi:acyl phosphate:glycerol-3-phosphate acyltransferase
MSLASPQAIFILIPAAYIAGSIPFGLLVGLAKGIDVRKSGSGNIGATNVGRLLGRRFFFIVFFLDLLKGLLPMLAAAMVLAHEKSEQRVYVLWLLVGFAAILGHMFSLFLKFKGGKGVATSTGVLLGLWPFYTLPGFGAIIVFVITLMAARYVSLASIIGSMSFPVFYFLLGLARHWDPLGTQLPLLIFAIVITSMVVYKHRGNIARLRAGTENKIGRKIPAGAGLLSDDDRR